MAKFKVAVTWEMYGNVIIQADDIDEAIHIAKVDPNIPLPEQGEYIDDSWQVDEEITREIN